MTGRDYCRRVVVAVMCTLMSIVCGPIVAQDMTADSIEVWAEKEFGDALAAGRFSAASISVVKNDELVFSRGYGFADDDKSLPMNPTDIPVRVCSLSKLFTATALMQLLDRGEVTSLDDPANLYLQRIRLPQYDGRDVTVRDIVTHRGGFEDSYYNAGTTEIVDLPLSTSDIERLLPKQVRTPGTLSVYSNANAAILGVLIEDTTGLSLREYLAANVFEPLGMTHSELVDNPPIPTGHANSFVLYEDESRAAVDIVSKHPLYAPSGGVISTANDMAQFMRLQLGAEDTIAVLSPSAIQRMHTPVVRNHPRLAGLGVQFFVEDINGQTVVSHSCGLRGFTSYLAVYPDLNVAMFVSILSASPIKTSWHHLQNWAFGNTDGAIPPLRAIRFHLSFLKEFVGYEEPVYDEDASTPYEAYAGRYKVERRSHTTMFRVLELLRPNAFMMDVAVHPEGGLSISNSSPYRSIGDHAFRRDSHPTRLFGFELDEGRAVRMYRSAANVYTRVPFWRDSRVMSVLISIACVIVLSGFLVGIGRDKKVRRRFQAISGILLGLLAVGFTLVSFGYAPDKNIEHYVNEGGVWRLIGLALVGNAIAVAVAAQLWFSGTLLFAGTDKQYRTVTTLIRNLHLIALLFAGVVIIYVLNVLNLLGLSFPWN